MAWHGSSLHISYGFALVKFTSIRYDGSSGVRVGRCISFYLHCTTQSASLFYCIFFPYLYLYLVFHLCAKLHSGTLFELCLLFKEQLRYLTTRSPSTLTLHHVVIMRYVQIQQSPSNLATVPGKEHGPGSIRWSESKRFLSKSIVYAQTTS